MTTTDDDRIKLLLARAREVPKRPGCYLMKDEKGVVIYVGKAKLLDRRIASYFELRDLSIKTLRLIERIVDFTTIITANEYEALILENNLIKKYRPKYNVLLRDDKSFPFLAISKKDRYPRLIYTRKRNDSTLDYYGPFPNGTNIGYVYRELQRIFPTRKCSDTKFRHTHTTCLYHQIGECLGMCEHEVAEESARVIADIRKMLTGKRYEMRGRLTSEMEQAAENLDFEKAATIRDLIAVIDTLSFSQIAVSGIKVDADFIGFAIADETEGGEAVKDHSRLNVFTLVRVRNSKVELIESFPVVGVGAVEELLTTFIVQFYTNLEEIPDAIYLPIPLAEAGTVGEWFLATHGAKVTVVTPKRGEQMRVIAMAMDNAAVKLTEASLKSRSVEDQLEHLKVKLKLDRRPSLIECYDISNISGTNAVGSKVALRDGVPAKELYRKYKIKTIEGQNDFGMMNEVITRRFSHIDKDPLPDLIVIDGGKGQLKAAFTALKEAGIADKVNIVGLAKARLEGYNEIEDKAIRSLERLFLPGRSNPVIIRDPRALAIITLARDEAHRFAKSYHAKLRDETAVFG